MKALRRQLLIKANNAYEAENLKSYIIQVSRYRKLTVSDIYRYMNYNVKSEFADNVVESENIDITINKKTGKYEVRINIHSIA